MVISAALVTALAGQVMVRTARMDQLVKGVTEVITTQTATRAILAVAAAVAMGVPPDPVVLVVDHRAKAAQVIPAQTA